MVAAAFLRFVTVLFAYSLYLRLFDVHVYGDLVAEHYTVYTIVQKSTESCTCTPECTGAGAARYGIQRSQGVLSATRMGPERPRP